MRYNLHSASKRLRQCRVGNLPKVTLPVNGKANIQTQTGSPSALAFNLCKRVVQNHGGGIKMRKVWETEEYKMESKFLIRA